MQVISGRKPVGWCFKPSQPLGIISGPTETEACSPKHQNERIRAEEEKEKVSGVSELVGWHFELSQPLGVTSELRLVEKSK